MPWRPVAGRPWRGRGPGILTPIRENIGKENGNCYNGLYRGYKDYSWVILGLYHPPQVENRMEKNMENEMETLDLFKGVYRDV